LGVFIGGKCKTREIYAFCFRSFRKGKVEKGVDFVRGKKEWVNWEI